MRRAATRGRQRRWLRLATRSLTSTARSSFRRRSPRAGCRVWPPLGRGAPAGLGAEIDLYLEDPAGAATGRAEVHVVRLAAIYATLDRDSQNQAPHPEAPLALWRYSADSARGSSATASASRQRMRSGRSPRTVMTAWHVQNDASASGQSGSACDYDRPPDALSRTEVISLAAFEELAARRTAQRSANRANADVPRPPNRRSRSSRWTGRHTMSHR
jgi:hypothetical protein